VVLCSPFTLFAVLGVIRQSVEAHEVARTSDEILACLGAFGDQWVRFSEQLDLVARRFDTVHKGLEDLTGPRRRQLERQLDRIDDLRSRRAVAERVEGDGAGAPARPQLTPVDRAG
ncbi:MAG TPA: DNA recombination protein RmuC, partial [Aquihabitans sp.]|nr:DNA recombination protein RmuC [Aquihabitans sp.]